MERHPIIESFIKNYGYRLDFFRMAAELCHDQCRDVLANNGIRAMVTHRAKREDSLRNKLYQRVREGRQYSTEEDIEQDVYDLSGVRVALYFPSDRPNSIALLKKQLDVRHERVFPTADKRRGADSYDYRFRGYAAVHLHAFLRPDTLDDKRHAGARVEIQVASVFMHAWAEVEHDLVYKALQGELSTSEYCLLDQVNGLAVAGELALEQLQQQMRARISNVGARFRNHYDLASFIHCRTSDSEALSKSPMGRADRLLVFLQAEQLDSPALLEPFLAMDAQRDGRSLVDHIVNHIIALDPSVRANRERLWRAIETDTARTDPYGQGAEIDGFESYQLERRLAKCHGTFESAAAKILASIRASGPAHIARWTEKKTLESAFGFDERSAESLISAHHASMLVLTNRWRGPDDELRSHVQTLEAAIQHLHSNFPNTLDGDGSQ